MNGRKILFLYKFLENILFRKIKFLISRSLIFKKKYKKYFNKYQIINFINLDTSRFKKFVGKKKDKNFLIIGYFDNSTVSFFNLCLKILKKNYKIYVSLQKEYRENFYLLKKSLGAKNIDTILKKYKIKSRMVYVLMIIL